jgi:glycosyltransferase involved in cell wall biosynthesis
VSARARGGDAASGLRRVGFNALFLDPGVSGGPETYLRQLGPAIAAEAPRLELEVATTRRGAAGLAADGWGEFARVVALPVDEGERVRHLAVEQLLLPRHARRAGWDVLHNISNLAPLVAGVPSVTTLHDLLFLRHRTLPRLTTFAMRWTIVPAAHRADALIAISAAARDEICEIAGFAPADFTVVPHGAGRIRGTGGPAPTPQAELRARLDLGDARVVLCVGAKRPHKNQALLVRAAALLPHDFVVVLAGHPEGYDAQLRALAAELGVAEHVRFVDYVPDADLEGLWSLAACAAFPTLAEGFGLPVLEAMARGVPVAASDLPVLHEVGGDVPHWFDPHDPAAAAAAVVAATADRDAAAAGRAQAERFSWTAAARATLAVYERVALRGARGGAGG